MRCNLTGWVIVAVISLAASNASAGDIQRDNLKGVRSFGVVVVVQAKENLGVDERAFQTAVEVALRKARIKIAANPEDLKEVPGIPVLNVNVNYCIHPANDAIVAYTINISMTALARLEHNPKRVTVVTLWNNSHTGICATQFARMTKDSVIQALDDFINDYLASNSGE